MIWSPGAQYFLAWSPGALDPFETLIIKLKRSQILHFYTDDFILLKPDF